VVGAGLDAGQREQRRIRLATELTINGDHMSGTATTPESHQLKIELTKAK